MDLTITPSAEKFIRRMIRFGGAGEDAGFRLTVSPGGCSGLSSEFSVEAEPRPGDAVVVQNGLKLFLPAESRLLLQGVTMDFVDTPMSSGLVFRSPQSAGCSTCGSSAGGGGATVSVSAIQVKGCS
ncbi:HesB/IscA family protein [Candidatus Methylocalor cossyra]|uniref:HesB/YadR/YfhF family protein n=1 Tax=Candidatus Methylocalor cossyra TaxID=3108543 RepID=A0ABM9NGT7_9GAMM